MDAAIAAQLRILPFDVLGTTLENNISIFEQNAGAIGALSLSDICSLISCIYVVFREHTLGSYVPQSLKTTVVDSLVSLMKNGMVLTRIHGWQNMIIVNALTNGDVVTLSWLYHNPAIYTSYSGATNAFLSIISTFSFRSIHVESLRWLITNISRDRKEYLGVQFWAARSNDNEVVAIIDQL